ncbi:MAG: L-threonylcarbamoyladenylate synthase [Candidatus Micrarchaeia archaeon]|jgi:L-threonylcarbamoyladenylate synthase
MVLIKAEDPNSIAMASEAIRNGQLIIYPTDTIYGIGGDARSIGVVKKIEELKGREGKPMSIVVESLEMASNYCTISPLAKKYSSLLPGPYTFVLARKQNGNGGSANHIAHNVGGDTIGIRVPASPFPLGVVRALGFPITSTSANYAGQHAPSDFAEINDELKYAVGVAVDGGKCKEGEASTVIDMRGEKPVVLRSGAGYARFQELQKNIL